MKYALDQFFRFIVGILFIFSGLIKINDPLGTSIKLKEYFEVFATDFGSFFEFFVPHSLFIAVFVVVLEVLLGIALLINYRIALTAWGFLILILLFSFLTFYSAFFNKVTDCGCFGDAIPLTPWESFLKDVVLLVLILYIFFRRKHYHSLFRHRTGDFIMLVALLINTFLAAYAIRHLPYIDFRPYKVGNNIPDLMEPSEPYRYRYIFEKNGETYVFNDFPEDTTYEYKDLELLNPEAQPKITDYHIWTDEGDYTEESLTGIKLIIVFYDITKASARHIDEINDLISRLPPAVEVLALTASGEEQFESFRHENQFAVPYYFADMTVLEAVIRSNPGLLLLKDGTVLGKWHHNDVPDPVVISDLIK
ncbi:MAG: DoxX family membrane protein [Cyclobacteriaceae bacterium]|nr:DoxX family membrane protein [Cyclobacteriaceae bacterium]